MTEGPLKEFFVGRSGGVGEVSRVDGGVPGVCGTLGVEV